MTVPISISYHGVDQVCERVLNLPKPPAKEWLTAEQVNVASAVALFLRDVLAEGWFLNIPIGFQFADAIKHGFRDNQMRFVMHDHRIYLFGKHSEVNTVFVTTYKPQSGSWQVRKCPPIKKSAEWVSPHGEFYLPYKTTYGALVYAPRSDYAIIRYSKVVSAERTMEVDGV